MTSVLLIQSEADNACGRAHLAVCCPGRANRSGSYHACAERLEVKRSMIEAV